ncbi:hypothetical protein NQ317_015214 [Molorchus minor]|uniref:Beta-hexosaminidase n=1 Tax=Molorchus minor TaxID=1323400 RepID=A0ABQ9JCY5_9CUCU|nr:hypothetical protein NQ317_015214 [Molorchus minor]
MGSSYSLAVLLLWLSVAQSLNSVWRWECEKGACQKKQITNDTIETALSLSTCRLFCSQSAALWPKPTGDVSIGNYLTQLNINSINIEGAKSDTPIFDLSRAAERIFKEEIQTLIPSNINVVGGKSLIINLDVKNPNISKISLDVDESYTLKVSETSDGRIQALVTAPTFFGARHALVTLGQLVIFDDLRDQLQIVRDFLVSDRPAYPYRGVLLDTSRNYISVDAIKRTIKAMGASKLNTFHWHITDSHSFPYVSKSRPDLVKYGAYSPSKIYSQSDVEDIIQYARERGIRVMPEFDAPAHVGEGWQNTSLVTCFNWQPWQDYCVEPPCGQFDPTKAELYDAIEDIYGDMIEQFQPDIFHMGGDEVNFNCWNSTANIVEWMEKEQGWSRTESDFIKLWNYFQAQALQRLYKKTSSPIPVWTKGDDVQITDLLENGYKLILSNYDALYLDCGFAGWVTDGNNWCSPYIGWQKVYENKPAGIAGNKKDQILGSEATLWTEQADTSSVDGRLWPRAAALAEVLWSEPSTGWQEAEHRFLIHRERLVSLGIDADAIEPQWCLMNEENCRIGATFNSANTNV